MRLLRLVVRGCLAWGAVTAGCVPSAAKHGPVGQTAVAAGPARSSSRAAPRSHCAGNDLHLPPGDWQCALDPDGTIGAGEVQSYDICVHGLDRKTSIAVGWDTRLADRLGLVLRASNGRSLSADTSAAVTLSADVGYKLLTVDLNQLRTEDPTSFGGMLWRIEIAANGFAAGDQEAFFYSVVTSSDLKLNVAADATQVTVGDSVTLTASVLASGVPVGGLSDAYVELTGPDPSARPGYAALHDDGVAPDVTPGDGSYAARIGPLPAAGGYSAKVRLNDFSGGCFQREGTVMIMAADAP
jgi:hypothetical protein